MDCHSPYYATDIAIFDFVGVNSFSKESLREDVMPAIAKITSKGQTTIPAEVRESLNFNPGDLLEWEVNADGSARVRRIQTTYQT